ncbi:UPF0158 family protein [Bacillus carboniphilus]|uniref:UPF0158 family protein n=1 Tax=Bacillus carboniphilus TaxID=86663 RepID=A0ABY9JV80_9BACI|nr:UPF0158 family protein [Bacillus carboniphilus]WLR42330.1 UPF0158 family protein [Bacillus carboniphilus]
MTIQVEIKELVEYMDMQFEESNTYLNLITGEFVVVTTEQLGLAEEDEPYDHLSEWEKEEREVAIDIIENFENYQEVPTRYEINEYSMMEDFCFTVNDERKQQRLLNAISRKGAFRRFKDLIIDLDIEEQWFSYRDERFKELAIKWCERHNVSYVD